MCLAKIQLGELLASSWWTGHRLGGHSEIPGDMGTLLWSLFKTTTIGVSQSYYSTIPFTRWACSSSTRSTVAYSPCWKEVWQMNQPRGRHEIPCTVPDSAVQTLGQCIMNWNLGKLLCPRSNQMADSQFLPALSGLHSWPFQWSCQPQRTTRTYIYIYI